MKHICIVTGANGFLGNTIVRALVLPLSVAKLTAPFCEAHYNRKKRTPLFTRYSLYTLHSPSNFSHEKADRELGYHTRPLEETVRDTVNWFRETGRL